MASGGGAFSPEEAKYLKSLPAVAEASEKRITYSDAFKTSCMRRYLVGESPVKLFREAGLDPALIGYKRIERCFARWRKTEADALSGVSFDKNGGDNLSRGGGIDSLPDTSAAEDIDDIESEPRVVAFPPRRGGKQIDMRDLLIYQQVRRIDELEQRIDVLRARLRERDARLGVARRPMAHSNHPAESGGDDRGDDRPGLSDIEESGGAMSVPEADSSPAVSPDAVSDVMPDAGPAEVSISQSEMPAEVNLDNPGTDVHSER